LRSLLEAHLHLHLPAPDPRRCENPSQEPFPHPQHDYWFPSHTLVGIRGGWGEQTPSHTHTHHAPVALGHGLQGRHQAPQVEPHSAGPLVTQDQHAGLLAHLAHRGRKVCRDRGRRGGGAWRLHQRFAYEYITMARKHWFWSEREGGQFTAARGGGEGGRGREGRQGVAAPSLAEAKERGRRQGDEQGVSREHAGGAVCRGCLLGGGGAGRGSTAR
jgi:hypothetical protein